MSSDWINKLTGAEREEWDAWVRDIDNNLFPKMESSAFVMSLLPDGKPDAKFCVELGMAIMLEKPIVTVASPGAVVPRKLMQISDEIIVGDFRTEAGRKAAQDEMMNVISKMMGREEEKDNGDNH